MSSLRADLELTGPTTEELSIVTVGAVREVIGSMMEGVGSRASRALSCEEDGSGVAAARAMSARGRRAEKRMFTVVS